MRSQSCTASRHSPCTTSDTAGRLNSRSFWMTGRMSFLTCGASRSMTGWLALSITEEPLPRTKGASGIVGWQRHMLMRDIAAGELNPDEIAERHGIPTQSVYDIRHRRKAELQVILDDWSNEFSDLWSVQKHDRVARLEHNGGATATDQGSLGHRGLAASHVDAGHRGR